MATTGTPTVTEDGASILRGSHPAEGRPMPPTGKSTRSDYVYVMDFADGKISHMTKIWNAGRATTDLGWAT